MRDLGRCIAAIGDTNGDGTDDFLLGSRGVYDYGRPMSIRRRPLSFTAAVNSMTWRNSRLMTFTAPAVATVAAVVSSTEQSASSGNRAAARATSTRTVTTISY